MTWQHRALCRTRPADWWEVGDDGNRLALAICSVCPVIDRCSGTEEFGVIRGGVAWDGRGERLGLCPCGRPVPYPGRAGCYACLPDARIPLVRVRRKRRRWSVDALGGRIEALRASGRTYRQISAELRVPYSTLRDVVRRRAVSTEDAA